MKLNTEMMLRIADEIELHPENFFYSDWLQTGHYRHPENGSFDEESVHSHVYPNGASCVNALESLTEHECGTVGCIAGWAVALHAKDNNLKATDFDEFAEIDNIATEVLFGKKATINDDELYASDDLFMGRLPDIDIDSDPLLVAKALRQVALGEIVYRETDEEDDPFSCRRGKAWQYVEDTKPL